MPLWPGLDNFLQQLLILALKDWIWAKHTSSGGCTARVGTHLIQPPAHPSPAGDSAWCPALPDCLTGASAAAPPTFAWSCLYPCLRGLSSLAERWKSTAVPGLKGPASHPPQAQRALLLYLCILRPSYHLQTQQQKIKAHTQAGISEGSLVFSACVAAKKGQRTVPQMRQKYVSPWPHRCTRWCMAGSCW